MLHCSAQGATTPFPFTVVLSAFGFETVGREWQGLGPHLEKPPGHLPGHALPLLSLKFIHALMGGVGRVASFLQSAFSRLSMCGFGAVFLLNPWLNVQSSRPGCK